MIIISDNDYEETELSETEIGTEIEVDPYYRINKDKIPLFTLFILSVIFWIFYFLNDGCHIAINDLVIFIHQTPDLLLIFYGFVVIPYIIFLIKLISIPIRFFWLSYSTIELRLAFLVFRIYLSVFSLFIVIFAFILSRRVDALVMGLSILCLITVIALNYKKDFLNIAEKKDKEREKLTQPEFSSAQEFTTTQMLMVFIFAIIFAISISNDSIKGFFSEKWEFMKGDIVLMIFFWIAVVLMGLWFVIELFVKFVVYVIHKLVEKFKTTIWILIIIIIIYFISKVIIFFVDRSMIDQPAISISTIIAIVSTMLRSSALKIYNFIKEKRSKS